MPLWLTSPDLDLSQRPLLDTGRNQVFHLQEAELEALEFFRSPRLLSDFTQHFKIKTTYLHRLIYSGLLIDSRFASSRAGDLYDTLVERFPAPRWTFMNYGYASDQPVVDYDDYARQLVRHLLSTVPITDRRVVEVGCGRGGVCVMVAAEHAPAEVTGLDFSANNIDFCRQVHAHSGVRFQQGDALDMPLPDDCADVLLSVESMHLFRSRPAFLHEAMRLLSSGGTLAIADYLEHGVLDSIERLEQDLAETDLVVVHHEDISAGVLQAIEQGRPLAKAFHRSLHNSGCGTWDEHQSLLSGARRMGYALQSGRRTYRIWICKRRNQNSI